MDIYPWIEEADGLTEWHVCVAERDYSIALDAGGGITVTDDHGQCMDLADTKAVPALSAILTVLRGRDTRLVCHDGRSMYEVANARITLDMNDLGV